VGLRAAWVVVWGSEGVVYHIIADIIIIIIIIIRIIITINRLNHSAVACRFAAARHTPDTCTQPPHSITPSIATPHAHVTCGQTCSQCYIFS
jgi:hypothetical protein